MSEDNGGKIIAFGDDVNVEEAVMGYAHLTKPDEYLGKKRHKIELLWPDNALPKKLIAAADALARETWGVGLDKLAYKGLKKGDTYADEYNARNDDEPEKVGKRDGYRGFHICTPTLKNKPFLIDRRIKPLTDEAADNLTYPGARVRAKLTPALFKGQKGKGVTFFIKTLQLLPGGKPLEGFGGSGGSGGMDTNGFEAEGDDGIDDKPFVLDDDSGSDLFE